MYDMNAFGQMPQYNMMAGPGGFTDGGMGQMMGGMGDMGGMMPGGLQQPVDPKKKKKRGMFGAAAPMFGLAGMLAQGGGMGALAPLLFGGAGFGLSRIFK